jgi:DNA polymerase-4
VLHSAIQPSLEETVTLEPDEVDDPVLWGKLLDVLQRLCRTLRSQRRVCKSLSLTIRYSDQVKVTKRERVKQETCWEVDMSSHLSALFQRCFRRRVRLRQMTVNMTDLTAYAEQVSLFDERSPDSQRKQERTKSLAVALDKLHDRFGEQAIRYGRSH